MKSCTANTFWKVFSVFGSLCSARKSLSPGSQLTYLHLLIESNRQYWPDMFALSDRELQTRTHLAKQTLTEAKRTLKAAGLIEYEGSARGTRYRILDTSALVGQQLGQQLGRPLPPPPQTPLPSTPKNKTENTKTSAWARKDEEDEERNRRRVGEYLSEYTRDAW